MSYLNVDNLSKQYGDHPALTNLSFQVESGEILALVGPDGAGKTTLIRILCGLLEQDSGHASIGGHDVATNFDRIKELLGYMPQQFSLYPDLSVEENLIFYAGLHGLRGRAYREKRDALYLFSNLAPFAKRRAAALSGGMKQKLALSCALMHEPRMLILDEPTTGVDPLSRRQFWEILANLKSQGVTLLVSTPYMDEVSRCDRACFVFDGKLLDQGPPAELAGQFDGQIYHLPCQPTSRLVDAVNEIANLTARRFGAGLHVYLRADDRFDQFYPALQNLQLEPARAEKIRPSLEDRFVQLMELQV